MASIHRLPLCAALCTAAVAAAGAASAQAYQLDEGVTVYGHRIAPDDDNATLSQAVGYADLDLTTKAGVDQLRWRVARAADDLCARLDEDPAHDAPVLPSCRASARDSAARQISDAVEDARYTRSYADRYAAYRYRDEHATSTEADRYDDEDR